MNLLGVFLGDLMNSSDESYYLLASGIDVVPLGDGNVLFKSDTLAIRIEGKSSGLFLEQVLPLLDGQHSLSEIAAQLPGISVDDLRHNLDALVRAQVLRRANRPQIQKSLDEQVMSPLLAMSEALGLPEHEAFEKLRQLRIAVIGLEGHGGHLASILVRCGVGTIILLDPYPCHPGNLSLMPLVGLDSVGLPRQQALKNALQAFGGKTQILLSGNSEITSESIFSLASDCHMLASCFDKGFSSIHYWVNRASLENRIPAIYSEFEGHVCRVGPLVIPDRTACYMCYRMRAVACQDDFSAAMSYEEFLDQQKHPELHKRGMLPMVSSYVASLLALEVLKCFILLSQPSLASRVLSFDALSLDTDIHTVLQKPDCPVCQKKKERRHPPLPELRNSDDPSGDLLNVAPQLLGYHTGIIRSFQQVQKDPDEPAQPYVFRAELSNHRFLGEETNEHRVSSGKGMTLVDAQTSALGEAIERYSGACWNYDEITYARRDDLDGDTLDPRRLVLYAPDQYEQLPYVPYDDQNIMGWVHARSLVTNECIFVPALCIYMSYEVRSPQEFLCPITSNGLAAGQTLTDAILKATLEVLERDAFMITWLNRLPCQRIAPRTHPDPDIIELCEAYQRRQVDIQLYHLPTDHPCHVFAALGVQEGANDGPAVVVGLGAGLESSHAARQAILEVGQVRPALRRRMRDPETRRRMHELVAEPHLVTELEDHNLLYASPESMKAFDFMLERPVISFEWESQSSLSSEDKLQRLIDHFSTQSQDLIYYNLTPPDIYALGIYTARSILPGFQPIHFGWKERRLGGERLYDLPHRLGIIANRVMPDQLNSDPHPLA